MKLPDLINPYHWATALRNIAFDAGWLASRKFDLPVICVGNLTVGGTGKTPLIEYIVNLLKGQYKVATLSRGYRRTTKGYVKAETDCDMSTIGDEPSQIKNKFPDITVAVDEKRVRGIEHLIKEERPDVILLDDAFQHRYVTAGLNILLVDYNRPIWRDNVLPFGRLREAADGIRRADAVVVTKCPGGIGDQDKEHFIKMLGANEGTPIFFATVCYNEPVRLFECSKKECQIERGTEVLLVTGIARPEPLKRELESRGARVTLMQYADHHNFTAEELQAIARRFESLHTAKRVIITTEKDAERITGRTGLPGIIKENIFSLPIKVRIINNENKFNQIVTDYVRENQRDCGILAVGNEDTA